MNKCIMIGNLTHDPEVTTTTGGITKCKFTIAVSRRFTNADGERVADFHKVVAWRGLAENCGKYLMKGSKVAVEGTLQNRSYTPEGTTEKKTLTEIVAEDVEFLNKIVSNTTVNNAMNIKQSDEIVDGEDLPF